MEVASKTTKTDLRDAHEERRAACVVLGRRTENLNEPKKMKNEDASSLVGTDASFPDGEALAAKGSWGWGKPAAKKRMKREPSGSSHANERSRAGNTSSPMVCAAAAMTLNEEKNTMAACDEFKFGDNEVSDALLARLSELGASAPCFVDSKRLQSTDARVNQNRLELSGRGSISRAFTDAEKDRARTPNGMSVTAFDRGGREYGMTCKLWKNDKHYRFMVRHHLTIAKEDHLTRRVTVELWAFRSRALRPPHGEGGEEPGHPDGAIGLVVLLRDDDGVKEEVAEEVAPEESYRSWFLLLMAAVGLLTLRRMDTMKRKRDDD